uniref:RNA polymerase I-specific transcription initiation factor RRN3 n=1 Tax=Aegilops tauschii TaxID=37682 RepID=M8C757_AEGTA
MGAELRRDDMAEAAVKPIRDSVAFRFVEHVLQSVRMDPLLVDPYDMDQYNKMVSTLDTSKKKTPDEEALYVTTLKALSEAVSKIDITYHHLLLNNAAVADQYLRECLQMLVNNFTPPLVQRNELPRWAVSRKKDIFFHLCESLKTISDTVPLAPRILRDIIDRSMPKLFDNKAKMVSFVECMLGLDTDRMGDLIGATLLAKVVDLLTELDVNITWEDIIQGEHNKGIFEMELEDLNEDEDGLGQAGTKVLFGGNACAEKLDSLMVVVCEHLKSCAERGYLDKEFDILKAIFRASVLRVHRSKFCQFIMFYACSLDPKICGLEFAFFLTEIFLNKEEDPISRMSAVSYVGSYLSRARFISADTVLAILKKTEGPQLIRIIKYFTGPVSVGSIFGITFSAVMYVLCFRLRSIMDYPNLKAQLFQLSFGFILNHRLEPLKVCLPSIVNEFLRQAKDAGLFAASMYSAAEDAIESDLSRAFGGINRLDTFFPFDPYLLKESDRYIRPNFEFWSMVKTTYSNDKDDDDDELLDLDAPEMNVGSLDDHVEIDINSDDDELEYSMNKMSITPHHSFYHGMAADGGDAGLSMPARIRPSASPPSRWAMSGSP